MINDLVWKINGFELPGQFGRAFATQATLWRPDGTTAVRRQFSIPGVHGVKEYGNPTWDEPKVVIVARFRYPTQAELEAAVNNWVALLTQPTVTLTRVSGGVTASAQTKLISLSHDDYISGPPEYLARITVVFGIPGVFLTGPTVVSADIGFTANLVLAEIPELSGSTGAIVGSKIRVTGALDQVEILDPNTGTGIYWDHATELVAAGQYLFLDVETLQARISSSSGDWVTGGTDVTSGVSFPANGPLQIWPSISGTIDNRKALFNASGGGRDSNTKLAFRAGRSFL